MIELLVFVVSGLLTWWFAGTHSPFQIHDTPNERSLHEHPTPRTGGMAILAAIALGWTCLAVVGGGLPETMFWVAIVSLLVASISLLDDLFELSPLLRLGVHLLAAGIMVMSGISLSFCVMGIISLLGLVWMLNLYNFMDGMDGFAGGMSLIGFGMMALAAWLHGDAGFSDYVIVPAVAALGFLRFNFPPARIFMGDAGSATLGLMAGAFALWGIRDGIFPLWFPLLVFSPFVLDATITLLRRGLRGEKVWQAHREHYYQRLVMAGLGHKRTVSYEYVLMIAVGGSAIAMLCWEQLVIWGLGFWLLSYACLAYQADRYCRKHGRIA